MPGEVEEECWRIGCGNVGRISVGGKLHKDNGALFQDMINHNLDVALLQELGINWDYVGFQEGLQARLDEWMEPGQTKSVAACNRKDAVKKELQWGGTGVVAHGKMSHFVMQTGVDKLGLGRWSWMRFRGRGSVVLRVVATM